MQIILLLVTVLISISLVSACQKQGDAWVGFYYPDGAPDVGEVSCEVVEFETEKECLKWGTEKKESNVQSDYYCGYRCKYDSTCQYAC